MRTASSSPAVTAQAIATGSPPSCESDGSDVPATAAFTCPAGATGPVEIQPDPRLLRGGGSDRVTSSSDYANSGARGGFDISDQQSYLLRFLVISPAEASSMPAGVHGLMMSGSVIVRRWASGVNR